MKAPPPPPLEKRRAAEFAAELRERARAWIPSWALADGEGDFGRALLDIAARFSAEVAERLDRAGEKMQRGFLDWLAVRGEAARPARMPVVFKLAEKAQPVLASHPVRMQADANGTSVVFETEKDVRVVPGSLTVIVGADADNDAFYLPAPGLSNLEPLEALPTQWQLKSYASADATKLQLDPEAGLVAEMILDADGQQYLVDGVDNGIVTIKPKLTKELPAGTTVRKVTTFEPFDGSARNRQEHVLYLGHTDLLNIEAAATLEVVGATALNTGVKWAYWGKVAPNDDDDDWQPLVSAPESEQQPDALVLKKLKGSVELKKIDGTNSRWIRAYREMATGEPFRIDQLALRINGASCRTSPPCPAPPGTKSPDAEGMANTTPLVLDADFFPLGKEPRQFDAFYLGSREAFSKKGADVQLCFEMADPSFAVLASLRGAPLPYEFLAGVGRDGYLHLLGFAGSGALSRFGNREPLRPPSPGPNGAAIDRPPITLDPRPTFRAPVWAVGSNIFIAVTAKSAVWIWREDKATAAQSGWEAAGDIELVAGTAASVTGLVYLADGGAGQLFALYDAKLYVRDLNVANPAWELVQTKSGGQSVALTQIVPINVETGGLGGGTLQEGLLGISPNNRLYAIELAGSPLAGKCTKLLDDVAPDIAPAGVRRLASKELVVVAVGQKQPQRKLLAFLSNANLLTPKDSEKVELDSVGIIGESIDCNIDGGGNLTFVLCLRVNTESAALAAWTPFDPVTEDVLFTTKIPAQAGMPAGAPTLLPKHVLVPTAASQVAVASFDVTRRKARSEKLETAVITSMTGDQLAPGDQLAIPIDDTGGVIAYERWVVGTGVPHGGQTLYEFPVESIGEEFYAYRAVSPQRRGYVDATDDTKLTVDGNDTTTDTDSLLLITDDTGIELYVVTAFDQTTRVATLDAGLTVADPTVPVVYREPETIQADLLPLLRLDPAVSGDWDAALLERVGLVFPGADPTVQSATAFQVDSSGHPILVALAQQWSTPPAGAGTGASVAFTVDASVGDWSAQLGETLTNPELSWEYSDGKGWSLLDIKTDATLNLKITGAVTFTVPDDLAESDWAGKTNHWIRARLVGGDYGREKVTVKTKTNLDGSTEQTFIRSTDDIRAPSVLTLTISYWICAAVEPTFVLTLDSGSLRDQSDANTTAGAIVEAFVPLAVTLGRLSSALTSPKTADDCPPAALASPAQTAPRETGRALFIGLDAEPTETPVNVLLLVQEERAHEEFAPMKVEALVADRFVPIVADDATRALGESGVLSMSFPVAPTRRELFGQKDLTWLRLAPAAGAPAGDWKPTLRGAYLNAAWASATETLTRELLGSSEGAPDLTLYLARPPVLHDTLELRVKEPLGEEDRAQLREDDPKRVLSSEPDLPGDWVLWDQVIDPADEPPGARVYSLDEAIGEIRFGDGLHGMIPPIGRDSIIAFCYQRTEPGSPGSDTVPANAITARTALNLVSPVESVEAVFAADQAAGGAPPESPERVVRFGSARQRHRGRAVTIRDLEDLSLESSPDIAQARAFTRRGYVVLVIVMKGKNPVPSASQVRELQQLLLASSPLSLSAPGALRIRGPRVRRLRTGLELRVESLDDAGGLTQDVKQRLATLFDSAIGGPDRDGWPLGTNPSEDDIAFTLLDVPKLAGIGGVTLIESTADGRERPWPKTLQPSELVMLADDPVRIQFATVTVIR